MINVNSLFPYTADESLSVAAGRPEDTEGRAAAHAGLHGRGGRDAPAPATLVLAEGT